MKRLSLILAAAVALCAVMAAFAGCGAPALDPEGSHTVTDHAGNAVEVPNTIDRIVVLDIYPVPAALSVFFGSASKIVGMAQPSMTAAQNSLLGQLYPEILNAQTGFIDGSEVNIEELLKLDPDVVFYSAGQTAQAELLAGAGIPALGISVNKWDYDCIETLKHWVELFEQVFPGTDKTKKVEEYSKKMYDLVQGRVSGLSDAERAKVFFLFGYTDSNITTSGAHFFGQWWCDAIGAVNVASELEKDNANPVNMEQIYQWDPEQILITNFNAAKPDDLYNNAVGSWDWSGVKAVQDKKVYKLPLGIYRAYTPGIDTPMTLLWMAQTVYPDLFSDIDIVAETQKYYKEVFGIELSADQASSIFAPASAAGTGFAWE
ncbi:MAG: ABC transporter substrate-binding protein [Clostridiales bacterium]|nr:ABC transporter substrate-binding protein [Clostridiales bacterium]